MDDKTLKVELRLENKDVPRDRISRIIWLHADELDPSKKPSVAELVDAGSGLEKRRRPIDVPRREVCRQIALRQERRAGAVPGGGQADRPALDR